MSIFYYLLVAIGSLILGFALGFLSIQIIFFLKDFFIKRKQRNLTAREMLKPSEKPTERGREEDERDKRELSEFREFEKLRAISKGERGTDIGVKKLSVFSGIARQSNIPTAPINIDKPVNDGIKGSNKTIKFD